MFLHERPVLDLELKFYKGGIFMRYQLSNRNSWHPLVQLMKQFEDDFFTPTPQTVISPQMEWQENEKAYLLSFDIPGMKEEDIKIDLKENTLLISAERKQSSEKKEGSFSRSEKFYGVYHRNIDLPRDVDAESVQAEYQNGVLEILIPKTEKALAKNIRIGKEGKLGERFLGLKANAKPQEKNH